MYNIVSRKAIIAGWELAGPFGHSNVLGVYCGVAFALVPLIDNVRWRVLCAVTLVATITASATRTALIGVGFRDAVVATLLLPVGLLDTRGGHRTRHHHHGRHVHRSFLNWDPRAFTDRGLHLGRERPDMAESPLFGKGFDWFANDAQYSAEIANWAFVGTGHNIVMDTLVKTGLVGMAAVVPCSSSPSGSPVRHPSSTSRSPSSDSSSAISSSPPPRRPGTLWPNVQLFPISAMIFAIIAVARDSDSDTAQDNVP